MAGIDPPGESYQIICSRLYKIGGLHYVFLPWQELQCTARARIIISVYGEAPRRPWAFNEPKPAPFVSILWYLADTQWGICEKNECILAAE